MSERLSNEQKRKLRKIAVWGGGVGVLTLSVIVTLYLSITYGGVLDTVIYVVLFGVGATFVPLTIMLGAPSFPRSFKKAFGNLHFVLGQLAFDGSYLVQREDSWEMCPGREHAVFVDGEWHEIEGGRKHLSVLGWKPFGILRYKEAGTMRDVRVDPRNLAETRADGGSVSVERANYQEMLPDATISGSEGWWLVDLKRVFSRGIKKIGDISLIEKAEEVTMRKEAKSSRAGGWEPIIGSVVGLIIGVATGYVLLGGV